MRGAPTAIITLAVLLAQTTIVTIAFAPTTTTGGRRLVTTTTTVVDAAPRTTAASGFFRKQQQQPQPFSSSSSSSSNSFQLYADPTNTENESKSKLPFLLDPGTKGGALFLSLVLFVVPIIFYNIILAVSSDVDELDLGRWIGVGFTAVATVGWLGTYLFRVVTKDMTYAKQLKDYENAVIAKRLEELDEDELQALVEEVDKDAF